MSTALPEAGGKTELNSRISELECEVRDLRLQVAELRTELCSQGTNVVPRVLQRLVDMTNEVLPGDVRIENGADPEYPSAPNIVFRVTPNIRPHNSDAIIDKEIEWHRAASKIVPYATCYFSLAID